MVVHLKDQPLSFPFLLSSSWWWLNYTPAPFSFSVLFFLVVVHIKTPTPSGVFFCVVAHLIHHPLLSPSFSLWALSAFFFLVAVHLKHQVLFTPFSSFFVLVVVHLKLLLGGGSPETPTPFFSFSAFSILVVGSLKRQPLSFSFLLSSSSWWFTLNANFFFAFFVLVVAHLKHQLISSPFLISFSWWWFTLKDQLLSLPFCFLLLGGGSP